MKNISRKEATGDEDRSVLNFPVIIRSDLIVVD